ncbi:MAG: hypothetical protein MJE77_12735 [Proteobacteria bacterium]|nr:hypothetical protein [Pseudomonadota bacterium]
MPQFLHWVNEYIAKCVNASYGRWENLWASEPPNVVWLVDDAAVLDKLVYCLANPVSSGLVPHGSQWPGLRTSPRDVGGTGYEVLRPPIFFRENGPMPVSATLAIERPAICPHLSDAELADHVQELVARREAEIRDEFVCSGRRFLGVKAVLRQQPSDSPNTIERRRSLSPRVVAKSKRSRVEALLRLKSFWMGHREALLLWRAGDRDVEFPAGTYAMRVFHGAACASGSSP